MNKSIMFILLELFSIRYFPYYCNSTIKSFRKLVTNHIENYDDFSQFKLKLYSDAVMLSSEEFSCVRNFITYLNTIDKIVKM